MANWWENITSKIGKIDERTKLAKKIFSDFATSPIRGSELRGKVIGEYGDELSPAQRTGLLQGLVYAMPKEAHNVLTDVLTGSRFPQAVTWGEPMPIGLRNTLQYALSSNVLPPKTISVGLGEETSPEKLLLHEAGHAGLRTYDPEKYETLMKKILSKEIEPQQELVIGELKRKALKKHLKTPFKYKTGTLEKYGPKGRTFPSTENLLRVLNVYPERQWPEEYYVEEMARKRKGY